MDDAIKYFYIPEWPVFYEDNHLLALYKPAGLLIQGDRSNDITLMELAKQWIKMRYKKPGQVFIGLVHRLDRPVAGVALFCRTSKAASRISLQFRTGQTRKQYIAIVEGNIPEQSGTIINYIERKGTSSKVVDYTTSKSSKAKLTYRVLGNYKSFSLVEIDLYTGKHHQIRLQLANMGFPVLGDLRYGASEPMPKRQIALFSRSLSVVHPTLQNELAFESPLPKGWPWPGKTNFKNIPFWNWTEVQSQVLSQYQKLVSL